MVVQGQAQIRGIRSAGPLAAARRAGQDAPVGCQHHARLEAQPRVKIGFQPGQHGFACVKMRMNRIPPLGRHLAPARAS
ncbi:Uncharacterised protein [Bordetella pertussis]|nr:Uncharacterised protein [Bordetella pertussis]